MDRNHSVVKYGCGSGLTSSHVRLNGMHARVYHDSLAFKRRVGGVDRIKQFMLYNQYEVHSSTRQPFCEPGDSGSFVFKVNGNSELECIGMVVGISSYGSCMMTSIKDILKVFNLPEELTSFAPPTGSQNSEQDFSSNTSQILSTLETLTQMAASQKQQGQALSQMVASHGEQLLQMNQMVASQGRESADKRRKIHEDLKLLDIRISAMEQSRPQTDELIPGQLGPWTTRPVDSSSRSAQNLPYIADNSD